MTYETAAGQMSIPKSIVARIDHDNFSYSSAESKASAPPVSAPQIDPVRGYDDVARLTVHDNSIDFAYIAELENNARSGGAAAIEKVAATHYAAAQFLVSKGDTDAAIDHYRQALSFAPDNLGLLLNLAVLYLRENQFTTALDMLEHARRVMPDSSPVCCRYRKTNGMGLLRREQDGSGGGGMETRAAFAA